MAKKRNNVKETELITENLIEDTQHSRLDYLLYAIDCSQMDENLIEECKNKESLSDLFWGELSVYGNLSEELIEKYKDKLNLGFIFLSKNLSRDFLFKYQKQIKKELFKFITDIAYKEK